VRDSVGDGILLRLERVTGAVYAVGGVDELTSSDGFSMGTRTKSVVSDSYARRRAQNQDTNNSKACIDSTEAAIPIP
jgi:hypothetical protein